MRQPFLLGCNPEPSSSTLAFCNSSWKFAMPARSFSSGMTPASLSLVAF